MIAEVPAIAAEQLVAADAGQNHCDVAPRELGHQEGRYERAIGYRLIHVPQQPRQQRDDIRLYDDLAVLGAEQLAHRRAYGNSL